MGYELWDMGFLAMSYEIWVIDITVYNLITHIPYLISISYNPYLIPFLNF